jgi:putative protease
MLPVLSHPRTPELLAPAGDLTCVRAAVENGADAVYFGLQDGFNARARAENLSLDNLAEVMTMLRRRDVRGYVTLNTLVFSEELPSFERILRQVAEAGVDAVLVQDLGVVRLIRQVCPDLPIHASTQMTLTNVEAIHHVAELGIDRVVLARELSLNEIEQIAQNTSVPLEVFVHGALCVAYSGQCLTSESLGGRSANRGHCAQACRLPYELVCDGQEVDLGSVRYLLSPQDLAGYEWIPALWSAGVAAFKIEGRLKTPEYVANITRQYRAVIDAAVAGIPISVEPGQVEEMELSFSRGFSPGWLGGCDHKQLVPGLSSAKRGVLLGQVLSVGKRRIAVRLQRSIRAGDGIVFEGDRASGQEQGGRVFQVWRNGRPMRERISDGVVELSFLQGSVNLSSVRPGCALWKTDDPELTRRLRRSYEVADPVRRRRLDIVVEAAEGKPLVLETFMPPQGSMRIGTEEVLQPARKHPLTVPFLREQLGRLGGTPYELGTVTAKIEGRPMIPLSVLGRLRRRWIGELDRMATAPPRRSVTAESVLPPLRPAVPVADSPATWNLTVLCRSLAQLRQVLDVGITDVIVDFEDIRQYASAVATARESHARIELATPRICKPGETGVFRALARHQPSGILARNLAAIHFYRTADLPVAADYSLNVANEITARYLHELGVQRMTASYDLNRDQILALVRAVPREWLEVVIHQHMPMFHMEHCVFCAVLSPGTNKTNCGRPCDRHQVRLRDRIGMEHPLTADVGCRNTLFNARAQSAAEVVPLLRDSGIQSFRVELLMDQPESVTRRTIELYQQLLAGRRSGKEVWTQLQAANRLGVTRGTLEEKRDPLAIL